jgi:hypothetical protein
VITLAWQRLFDREERAPRPAPATKCAARDCLNATLGPDAWWCSPGCLQTWTGRHNHVSGLL